MTEPEHDEADAIEQRTPVDPSVDIDDPDAAADEVPIDDEEHPYAESDPGRFH
jgi:hypothetical protein